MLSMLAFFVLLAVLVPLFGADSRDGLDWATRHFFRPGDRDRDRADAGPDGLRMSDSPAAAGAGRAAAAGCRTAPAAG